VYAHQVLGNVKEVISCRTYVDWIIWKIEKICWITKFLMCAFGLLKLAKVVADSVQATLKRNTNPVVASLKDNGFQFSNKFAKKVNHCALKLKLVRNIAFSESLSILPLLDCNTQSFLERQSL
jgi:hypothetical protein